MYMRIAIQVNIQHDITNVDKTIDMINKCYNGLKNKDFIFSSPTLFNSGK